MEAMDRSRGQTYHIYNLIDRHQLPDLRGSVISDEVPTKEWLEAIKDVMRINTMMDEDKIQCASLLLKDDVKV